MEQQDSGPARRCHEDPSRDTQAYRYFLYKKKKTTKKTKPFTPLLAADEMSKRTLSISTAACFTPACLSSRVVATHLVCHLCPSAPSVTGSPSVSLEGTVGGRRTRKVILGENVLWTSLRASGQDRHAAERRGGLQRMKMHLSRH